MLRKRIIKTWVSILVIKKNFSNWLTNSWWIILICLISAFIISISIINNSDINRITTTIFKYFNQIIAPLGVVLGLILGYPLLKRKLIDNYITKQFEIIHENNRVLRKQCLILKDKYPIQYNTNKLTSEFLSDIVSDLKSLNELAIDANPDAYKYTYLLYKSLQTFSQKNSTLFNKHEQYYCEKLSTLVNNHLGQIYQCSKSIGYIPYNSDIKEKPILTTKLKKFVVDNKYYQVDGVDHSFSFKNGSALLVAFFSININTLSAKNGMLFQCCYEHVSSPSPIARIMYNQNIYMPLVLEGEKVMNIIVPKLVLVGFVRVNTTKIESGITTKYLICHYANISMFGFVNGTIHSKQAINNFKDTYIGKTIMDVNDIEEFHTIDERIVIKIDEKYAMNYFNKAVKILCTKMDNEVRS